MQSSSLFAGVFGAVSKRSERGSRASWRKCDEEHDQGWSYLSGGVFPVSGIPHGVHLGLSSSSHENSHPSPCSLHGEAAPVSQTICGTLAFGSWNPRMVWDVSKLTPWLVLPLLRVSHLWVRGDRIPGDTSRLSWFPEADVPTPVALFAGSSKLTNYNLYT